MVLSGDTLDRTGQGVSPGQDKGYPQQDRGYLPQDRTGGTPQKGRSTPWAGAVQVMFPRGRYTCHTKGLSCQITYHPVSRISQIFKKINGAFTPLSEKILHTVPHIKSQRKTELSVSSNSCSKYPFSISCFYWPSTHPGRGFHKIGEIGSNGNISIRDFTTLKQKKNPTTKCWFLRFLCSHALLILGLRIFLNQQSMTA